MTITHPRTSHLRRGLPGIWLVLLLLVTMGCSVASSEDGRWYVSTRGKDRNNCRTAQSPCRTIAAAIRKAAPGDTIHIADGWYHENLSVTMELHLAGQSMEQTVIDGSQLGPVITFRGTDDPDGMDFSLSNLTLTGGAANRGGGLNISGGRSVRLYRVKIIGNVASDRGGGIFTNYARLLVLDEVQLLDNRAANEGGGVYYIGGPLGYTYYPMEVLGCTIRGNDALSGGGIYSDGNLNVSDSLVEENMAEADGGGIYNVHKLNVLRSRILNNSSQLSGGGICSEDSGLQGNEVSISESTVDGNHAKNGGGLYNRGTLVLQASTVSNNQALDAGGGIWDGGLGNGLNNYFFSINSTISGNHATHGGGIWGGEIRTNGVYSGHIELINLTIANNGGKGIFVHAGSISLRNILLAANEGGNCDITVPLDQKNNLSDDPTCRSFIQADPLIGPLADNGGPTFTHKLLPGSPAVDRAIDTAGLYTDQRDFPRPRDGDWDNISDMDIGSYEADYPEPPGG